MMNRKINKVAILGSGVMGSRIACHFANIGVEVILLDIVPKEAKSSDQPKERNKLVNDALLFALKSKPSPIYSKSYVNRITTGNFDDDLSKISSCDWIIEVVIENLKIKHEVFANVEKYRTPGTLITSNTSGIPIQMMLEGRSDDFQQHFCGTHFFNPPRYLKLFEVIPGPKTNQEVVDFFMHYGDLYLGKNTVLAKDTPAFIGNRVGVFSMMAIMSAMQEFDLTTEEVDLLTGKLTGRPKSATFRTADVVGLDTFAKVASGVQDNAPDDEKSDLFTLPSYVTHMLENKMLGSKTKQGFYKKVRNADGSSEIQTLDLKTLEYRPKQKSKFASVAMAKPMDDLKERLVALNKGQDKAADFLRKVNMLVFQYVSNRIPEIADNLYQIDAAVKSGFGWELGPFEIWDTLGVQRMVDKMEENDLAPAQWVKDMLASGVESFYQKKDGKMAYYNIAEKSHAIIPGTESFIILDNIKDNAPVWKNSVLPYMILEMEFFV